MYIHIKKQVYTKMSKQAAYDRYISALHKSQATKTSSLVEALGDDFVRFVLNYQSQQPDMTNVQISNPEARSLYTDLMSSVYGRVDRMGTANRGASFQLFSMFRNVDLGRQADGLTVDWGGITNQMEIREVFYSSDTSLIKLENALLEWFPFPHPKPRWDFDVLPGSLCFDDGDECAIFRRETIDGVDGIRYQYRVKTPRGSRLLTSVFMSKIDL